MFDVSLWLDRAEIPQICQFVTILMMLILITWLRWCLTVFTIMKLTYFPLRWIVICGKVLWDHLNIMFLINCLSSSFNILRDLLKSFFGGTFNGWHSSPRKTQPFLDFRYFFLGIFSGIFLGYFFTTKASPGVRISYSKEMASISLMLPILLPKEEKFKPHVLFLNCLLKG